MSTKGSTIAEIVARARATRPFALHTRDALCQLKCCHAVVQIMQTDRMSARGAILATALFIRLHPPAHRRGRGSP